MDRTYHSILIQAPAERVWATIRDFHDASWAPGLITSVTKVGDRRGDEAGARRVVNGAFKETLLEFDDANRTLSYTIEDGPSPFSPAEVPDYVVRVQVRSVTEGEGGTFVEWSSQWQKPNPAAVEMSHGMRMALLNEMKTSLETPVST